MKSYRMPVYLDEEDKIFGGVCSARQFLTLAGGVVGAGAGALMLPAGLAGGLLKVAVAALFLGLGAALAFGRVSPRDLRLDQYLALRVVDFLAPKDYPYRGPAPPVEEGDKRAVVALMARKGTEKPARCPGLSRRGGHPRRNA